MPNQNITPADPGTLHPDALIPFSAFADRMPGVSRRWIEKASAEGRFVPGSRLTPRSPMVFRAGAVARFLNDLAGGPVETPAMWIAVVDESALGLEPAALKALILGGKSRMEVAK